MKRTANKLGTGMAVAVLLVGTGMTALSAGCGVSATGVCEAACECRGCSSADEEACVAEFEQTLKTAEFRECEDLFDDYLACVDATGTCVGDDFETSCNLERGRLENCTDEGAPK